MTYSNNLSSLIDLALQEDLGSGDLTSKLIIPFNLKSKAVVRARTPIVLSGTSVFQKVMERVDSEILTKIFIHDGAEANPEDIILELTGPTQSILAAERTALNFLMRLTGIATLTRKYVKAIGSQRAHLLDTRKTTPGFRILEKAAVRHGGGKNHRFALYDGILIKDNHIQAAGGVKEALSLAKQNAPLGLKIELEVETIEELIIALENEVDIILLDNMDIKTLTKAVETANLFFAPHPRRVILEASGGVNLETIGAISQTGVDYISVGAITHSASWADLGLDFI